MFTAVLKGLSTLFSSVLGHVLPLTLLLFSFTSMYYLYRSNESLKDTIAQQSLIISDLREVHVKLGGLYSEVYNRLNKEGVRASESLIVLEEISKVSNIMNEELPKEVVDVLNGKVERESKEVSK